MQYPGSAAMSENILDAWRLQEQGDAAGAERLCRKALRKAPADVEALQLLSVLELRNGHGSEARTLIEKALRIAPRSLRAQSILGSVLSELGDHEAALVCFQRVASAEPDNAEVHFNIANTLDDLGRAAEAITHYEIAISNDPAFIEAHRNRGILLFQLGRHAEALDGLNRALSFEPSLFSAVLCRGKTFLALQDVTAALRDFDAALALQPNDPEVHNLRGIALRELERFDDALASFRLAIVLSPDHAGAHWNEGLCRLTMGDWCRESWKKYEWGWGIQRYPKRVFPVPLWLGEALIADKTILLHDEQGLGDTIQFARFASDVAALGATVILQVQHSLKGIMQTLAGPVQVISERDERPNFDYHCPLLSLPLALGLTLDNLQSPARYLHADRGKEAEWKGRLGEKKRLRVGIAWAGSAAHRDDRRRSIPLAEMLALASPHIELVSLQKKISAEESQLLDERGVRQFADELQDFSDTAALVMQMDLVISVSTAVAHLAAALGQPTWILLSKSPDWRWLRERSDTPWHPTARLFRQRQAGAWPAVIEEAKLALERFGVTA